MTVRKIIVASSKGGVGKSTVALGVAAALNSLGKRVLLFDLDFENKCLDLFLGASDDVVFNVADVAAGRADARRAALGNGSGFYFIAAPDESEGEIDPDSIADATEKIAKALDVDFAVFDTGTAHGIPEALGKKYPGAEALVVASHQSTSTRGAERTAKLLDGAGVSDSKLVICGFDLKAAHSKQRNGILGIIDDSKVPLIGAVPYDRDLMLSHERGIKAKAGSPADRAFTNIARRILGEQVRLFDGIDNINRKMIIG